MGTNLYYVAPPDTIFNEVKTQAIRIWESYDNTYGYVDEKVSRIKHLTNIKDNFMYLVAMFDSKNQLKLSRNISTEANEEIKTRLIASGVKVFNV